MAMHTVFRKVENPYKKKWCAWQESNLRHTDYESVALSPELQARVQLIITRKPRVNQGFSCMFLYRRRHNNFKMVGKKRFLKSGGSGQEQGYECSRQSPVAVKGKNNTLKEE